MINESKLFDPSVITITEDTSHIDTILEYGLIQHGIAQTLVEYRLENKLTQSEFAERLGVTQAMISKLEDGNYNPTLKQLHKISRKLTKSTQFLIDMLTNILTILHRDNNVDYTTYYVYNNSKAIYTAKCEFEKMGGINDEQFSTSKYANAG